MLIKCCLGVYYLSSIVSSAGSPSSRYQTLAALATASPLLLDTIMSLAVNYPNPQCQHQPTSSSACHLEFVTSLREALSTASSPSQPRNEYNENIAVLATTLIQIANIIFVGGSGTETHFVHALKILRDLEYINHRPDDALLRLLIQKYAMLDVTRAILQRRRPLISQEFWLFADDDAEDGAETSFHAVTGCPLPLLGIFSRLALLAADLNDGRATEFEVLTKTWPVEMDLYLFGQFLRAHKSSKTESNHLTSVGLCFYWSAHLVLQRAVYRDSTSSPRVQHTVSELVQAIRRVPVGCGPDSFLLFPFYMSSREAIAPEHRNWVRERNRQTKEIYPSPQQDALVALLEEIWTTIDAGREHADHLNQQWYDNVKEIETKRDLCLL